MASFIDTLRRIRNSAKSAFLSSIPGTKEWQEFYSKFQRNPISERTGQVVGQNMQRHPNLYAPLHGISKALPVGVSNRVMFGNNDAIIAPTNKAGKLTSLAAQMATNKALLPFAGFGNQAFGASIGGLADKALNQGQDTFDSMQRGVTMGAITGGTSPLIEKAASPFTKALTSPLARQLATRTASGMFNIPEGMLINKATDIEGYSPTELAIDFGTGFAIPGSKLNRRVFDKLRGVETASKEISGKPNVTLPPEQEKRTIDDLIKAASKDKDYQTTVKRFDEILKTGQKEMDEFRQAEAPIKKIDDKIKGLWQNWHKETDPIKKKEIVNAIQSLQQQQKGVPQSIPNVVSSPADLLASRKYTGITDSLENAKTELSNTNVKLEQNTVVNRTFKQIDQQLAPVYEDLKILGLNDNAELVEKYIKDIDSTPNKEVRDVIERIIKIEDDVASFRNLKEKGKYLEGHLGRMDDSQVFTSKIKLMFLNSPLRNLSKIYDPMIKRTSEDFVGDASVSDRLRMGVLSALDNARQQVGGIDRNKSIIDQLQKGVDPETVKPFEESIGVFKEYTKDSELRKFSQFTTKNLENPFYGFKDTGLWADYFEPVIRGQAEYLDWVTKTVRAVRDDPKMAHVLADSLRLQKGTKEYTAFIGELSGVLAKASKDPVKRDRYITHIVKEVGSEIFVNRPALKLENWIKTHEITDPMTKGFLDSQIKSLFTDQFEEMSKITEAILIIDRISTLGIIGIKVSTMLLQSLEIVRAFARYSPKHSLQAVAESFQPSKTTYNFLQKNGLDYFLSGKKVQRIPRNEVDEAISYLESVGFYGMGKAEAWKNRVFLRAAELKGIDDGLKRGTFSEGDELGKFVNTEFREYAHYYAADTMSDFNKNPYTKFVTKFSTYPMKQMDLLLRTVEKIVGGGKEGREAARFLTISLFGAYVQYNLFQEIYGKSKDNLALILTGGMPQLYSPSVDLAKQAVVYAKSLESGDEREQEYQKEQLQKKTASMVPFGNQLYNTTYKGITDITKGYSETLSGNVRYPAPTTIGDIIKTATISRYANEGANNYYANREEGIYGNLSEIQSDVYRDKLQNEGQDSAVKYYYDRIKRLATKKGVEAEIPMNQIVSKANAEYVKDESKPADSVVPQQAFINDILKEAGFSEAQTYYEELVKSGVDINQIDQYMTPKLQELGITQEEWQVKQIGKLDTPSKAKVLAGYVGQGQMDIAGWYKSGLLTAATAKELERMGVIDDAEELWDKARLTDSYYYNKELRRLRKKLLKEYKKNIDKIRKEVTTQEYKSGKAMLKSNQSISNIITKQSQTPKLSTKEAKPFSAKMSKYTSPRIRLDTRPSNAVIQISKKGGYK